MPACASINCTNRQLRGCGKTFHVFPFSQPEILKKWVISMKRDNWSPSKKSVLCSDHFEQSCFDRTGQTTRLKAGVVPTSFKFPVHLQKCTKKRKQPKERLLPPDADIQCAKEPMAEEMTTRSDISIIQTDHTYFTKESPRAMKHKLDVTSAKLCEMKKRLKVSQQKTRRLHKKVDSLKTVVKSLQDKQLVSNNGADVLSKTFSGVPSEIMKRMMSNKHRGKVTREQYPPVLRAFALTLQFYSTKAYKYVRKSFDLALPHPTVIRKWYSGINGEPGFTQEAFTALQCKVKEAQATKMEIPCALMLDEMAIRKHVSWDGKKVRGYVDIGTEISDDSTPVATEALVLMVVCLNKHWKIPVGYFLINGMSGEERANLVKQCISKLSDVGVQVVSLTCDGPSCHFTMLSSLGANLKIPTLDPSFPHPINPSYRISVLLDICHMLKLLRNTLGAKGVIVNGSGKKIKWSYIENLHNLQQEEGLRAGNKLRSAHIEWQRQKMKVNLAAQTLSSSVADALEFCQKDLKLTQFKGCEATVEFIRKFDQLFDLMNSRNPLARNFKAPMHPCNEKQWRPFLSNMYDYISSLKNLEGNFMYETPRKTAFIGFLAAIKSLQAMYDSLVRCAHPKLKYLLTYKMSQDHLELFFCAVRSAGGTNNNPTSGQFSAAYKRLLIRHEVKGLGGNCIAQDHTGILHATSAFNKKDEAYSEVHDMFLIRKYDMQNRTPAEEEHDYTDIPNLCPLTLYKKEVIAYIAGYVVRMASKRVACADCVGALTSSGAFHGSLLNRKNRGGLLKASPDVVQVCGVTEQCIQRLLKTTDGALPQSPGIAAAISTAVLGEVAPDGVFDQLYEHTLNGSPECNHVFLLIKCLAACYIKIRMHHLTKQFNAKISGPKVRKQLSKLVLFRHQ